METSPHDPGNAEARRHPRYRAKEDILVYNETTFAEIIDISEAGLSCRYLVNLRDTERRVAAVDLLNGPERLHVRDIKCREVYCRDEIISLSFPSTVLRTCGITFADVDEEKNRQIKHFIHHSTVGPH